MKRIKSSLINFGNPRYGKDGDSSKEEDGGDFFVVMIGGHIVMESRWKIEGWWWFIGRN